MTDDNNDPIHQNRALEFKIWKAELYRKQEYELALSNRNIAFALGIYPTPEPEAAPEAESFIDKGRAVSTGPCSQTLPRETKKQIETTRVHRDEVLRAFGHGVPETPSEALRLGIEMHRRAEELMRDGKMPAGLHQRLLKVASKPRTPLFERVLITLDKADRDAGREPVKRLRSELGEHTYKIMDCIFYDIPDHSQPWIEYTLEREDGTPWRWGAFEGSYTLNRMQHILGDAFRVSARVYMDAFNIKQVTWFKPTEIT